jgi:RNA-directed DNA polymerase
LEINREKTPVVDLREEEASLNFLGYTFGRDRDRKGRDRRFLNVFPSKKAVQREREKLHEMTNSHQCFKPIPILIGELNRHLKVTERAQSFGSASARDRIQHKRSETASTDLGMSAG